MADRKLGKIGNLGNLGKIIPTFLIFESSILPYSRNRKLGFKNLGKKFPTFLRFPRFLSFRIGPLVVAAFETFYLNVLINEAEKSRVLPFKKQNKGNLK